MDYYFDDFYDVKNVIKHQKQKQEEEGYKINLSPYKFYGLTKSNDEKYKYEAIFTDRETGQVKHIKFGTKGYKDYIWYQANTNAKNAIKQKRIFYARNIHNIDFGNPKTASWWCAQILWNRVNLEYSLKNTLKALGELGYL
jgi:hypothetical protein